MEIHGDESWVVLRLTTFQGEVEMRKNYWLHTFFAVMALDGLLLVVVSVLSVKLR